MPESRSSRLLWFALAILLVLADQYSKALATSELLYAVPRPVFSWFNLTLHHNQGAAFSFLSDAGGWQRWFFITLGVVVVAIMTVWMSRLRSGEAMTGVGLALVVGGAVGNIIDRVWLGKVIDFLQWHWEGWYWPSFNVADSAITLGVVLLLVDGFRAARTDRDS